MNAPYKIPDHNPDVPDILSGMSFASDFRHWTGGSGRRYLTRAFPLDRAADFPGAPVILAAVDKDDRREAVWIGISVGRRFEEALETARAAGATEAHVHLVTTGAVARVRVLRDLRAAMRPVPCVPEHSTGAERILTPGEIAA